MVHTHGAHTHTGRGAADLREERRGHALLLAPQQKHDAIAAIAVLTAIGVLTVAVLTVAVLTVAVASGGRGAVLVLVVVVVGGAVPSLAPWR